MLIEDGQVLVWDAATKQFVPSGVGSISGGLTAPGSNGLIVHTGSGATVARTIVGTANQVSVSNGDGVSGNPTLSIPANSQLSIAKLTNLTSNGLVKTSGGDGTLSVDTTVYASQAYVDSAVAGLLDDRGNFDASGGAYPSSGGSGPAGAIMKGDIWVISVAGTLPTGQVVNVGDQVRALIDTPGNTQANWAISEANIGYVPLNQALADGKVYVGNGSGIATAVTPSGDVTISNTGVTAIGANKVTNAMLAGSIAFSKLTGTDRTLTAGEGLTGGGDLSADRTFDIGAGAGITVNANDVALTTPGTLTVSTTNNASGNHTHAITSSANPGAAASLLATDAFGFLALVKLNADTLADRSGGNLTISPAGDVLFNPAGKDLLPATSYDLNFGAIDKKFLTVHAAELWVQTLVAQNTLATIGGRILVAPTAPLTAAVGTSDTTIDVKYNNLTSGDRIQFEANGNVEFMAVTSDPTTIAGGYRYSVTRNLDGTGANAWNAGDAAVNTGTAGNGFWDLFSLSSTVTTPTDFIYIASSHGATFSANFAQSSNWQPLSGMLFNDDAMYFGVQNTTWANLYFNITTAAVYTVSGTTWEYWNGTAWTTFTPTAVGNTNGDFKSTGWQGFEWSSSLSGWASTSVNSQTAFWVRFRYTATVGSVTTLPKQTARRVYYNKGQIGPTQVLWKRNSSTWNDISEHAAFGELAGFYGYAASTTGIALGEYAASKAHVTIDSTNGFRIFSGLSTVVGQWDVIGNVTVGATSGNQGNVSITSAGALSIRRGTTDYITLNSTDAQFTNLIKMTGASAAISLGTTPPTSASAGTGIWLDRTGLYGLASSVVQAKFDAATGAITAGAENVILDSSGIAIVSGTGVSNKLLWKTSGVTTLELKNYRSGSSTSARITGSTDQSSGLADIAVTASNDIGQTASIYLYSPGSSLGAGILNSYVSISSTSGLIINSGGEPAAILDVRGNGLFKQSDSVTNAMTDVLSIQHNSTGTPAANFGGSILFSLQSSTTSDQSAGRIGLIWTTATHASRTSAIVFQTVNNASALTEVMRLGQGLQMGAPTGGDKGAGTINIAGDIYKNNTAYTNPDYVLEHWATGRIEKFRANEGAAEYKGLMPLSAIKEMVKAEFALPRIVEARKMKGALGLFDGGDALLASLEEAYLYIFDLQEQISRLQERLR